MLLCRRISTINETQSRGSLFPTDAFLTVTPLAEETRASPLMHTNGTGCLCPDVSADDIPLWLQASHSFCQLTKLDGRDILLLPLFPIL